MTIKASDNEAPGRGAALPGRIARLHELADNLWWSWHEEGRQLFRSLDYALWRTSGHNPVKQLHEMSPENLRAAASDPAFLVLYDSVMRQFDSDMRGEETWYGRTHLGKIDGPVAYFSAEYAIHASLPIYAGGLGVLAGDICKEASDLGLPLVAVGFMYPEGYFHQHVSPDGWQEEVYAKLNFDEAPISQCPWTEACGPLISFQLANRRLSISVWLARVGRVNLYLLDTNVEGNAPGDRSLSARLYTADPEERIQQLIILGTVGVRALRRLGINPAVWHANEDHTVFMMLERLREELEKGATFQQGVERVRARTIFTTHTPIPAGHNIFSIDLLNRYAGNLWESLGIDRQTFLEFGLYDGLEPGRFSLAAAALRLAGQSNAVSKLHGEVTRQQWKILWPGIEGAAPITHITNGIHRPSWQAPEFKALCIKHLGKELLERQDDPHYWACVLDIPDAELWEVRQILKTRLIRFMQERAQQNWIEGRVHTQQVLAMGSLLDTYALTIAFTRRFTEYKRPDLILHDLDRLRRIVTNPSQPVQIIFAGKSHPADVASKRLLQQIYRVTMDRSFQGRISFVEDYDMHIARDLVRGADVWMNTPRRLQEACGTSGMKASMNGALNLSIRDGWWYEAYNGSNGWAVGGLQGGSPDEESRSDAEALYELLEREIVPLYYDRDRMGVPHRWMQMAKEAIRTITPDYCACRMVKEYAERMYIPAAFSTEK